MASYASVVWTTGDILTETKLDNMVANDQSEDAHAANGMIMNNNVPYKAKNAAGTSKDLIKMATDDTIDIGASGVYIDLPYQPRSRSRRSGTQSINNTSDTIVTYDIEDYDIGSIHDISSNVGRVTIPTGGAGIYSFKAGAAWSNNETGFRVIDIIKNGTIVLAASTNDSGGSLCFSNVSGEDEFSAGDFIEVRVRQNSGGDLTILGDERTFFAVSKIA